MKILSVLIVCICKVRTSATMDLNKAQETMDWIKVIKQKSCTFKSLFDTSRTSYRYYTNRANNILQHSAGFLIEGRWIKRTVSALTAAGLCVHCQQATNTQLFMLTTLIKCMLLYRIPTLYTIYFQSPCVVTSIARTFFIFLMLPKFTNQFKLIRRDTVRLLLPHPT